MSQISDIQSYSPEDILKILHSEAQKMPLSPTSFRYLRALESLTATSCISRKEQESQACPPPLRPLREALGDWIVNMWLMGVPFSTASLYLDIISALYGSAAKQDLLPKTELFSDLKARLKQLGQKGWTGGINEEIFARALRLTKNAHRLLLDDSIAADLILLSLTHNLVPIERMALLRRDPDSHVGTAEEQRPQIMDTASFASLGEMQEEPLVQQIIARHCPNARRKYVFPLSQSQRTEVSIRKNVFKMVNALFRRARLPQSTDPNHTVESLWAYAALTTGVPASQIVAYLGHTPLGLPILKLTTGFPPPQRPQREIPESSDQDSTALFAHSRSLREMQEVGKVFLDNPARWYAMSLRPGVRFTQVCRRIQTLLKTQDSRLKTEDISLFYPCEEIARAIGKKIVIKQRPFIHSVVFFKAKLTDIGPLFARIGDLAWCYRQSARPGAPYADISQTQFQLFQQTIARFTPDYEVAPIGELELKPNDRVQIVGGLFAGHEATVEGAMGGRFPNRPEPTKGNSSPSEAGLSQGETIYRLNIIGENGIEWRINADSRVIKSGPQAPQRVSS